MGFWEKFDRRCTWPMINCGFCTTLIVAVVVAVVIVALGVFFPPKFASEDAVLQRFDFSAATRSTVVVSYNITVMLALHNRNIYRGITYGPMAASFFFNGSLFDASTVVEGFYHKPRKTVRLPLTVGGVDSPVSLAAAGLPEFEKENVTGSFGVELRLATVMQYKGLKKRCLLIVVCPLKLQVVRPAAAAAATNCTSTGEHGEHNFCPTPCYRLKKYGRYCSV